eukprot:SAG31_NODE_5697_length_2374_cov_3.198681_2_plen_85_part_00
MESRKREQDEAAAKTIANRQARLERANQRVIDAYEKEQAKVAQLEVEQAVKERLVEHGFWTSKSEFVLGSDMKDFMRRTAVLVN